ncbi:MAG: YceH family protein [Gemmataceae bacterium]
MSSEMESSAPKEASTWPVLDMRERRVLGVLIEKAKTTPDTYPLSVNALVTGCNQKSNRDPLLNLTDLEVEDTLARCQKKGLAIKITGGRVVRWKHNLYEAWHVDKADLAVLGELLLRGPQTEGELRSRASRMEPIDDLDALRMVLRPLVERKLVVYLTPEERRGAVLTHGFHDPHELERLRSRVPAEPSAEITSPAAPASSANDERLSELESGLRAVSEEIAALKQTIAGLQEELRQLKHALGV